MENGARHPYKNFCNIIVFKSSAVVENKIQIDGPFVVPWDELGPTKCVCK